MSELDAVAETDPAWAADLARDRALSNEQLAREVADLAADGRPIYGTLLGLLNRLRPQTPAADLGPVGQVGRARSLTSLDVETLKTAVARTIIGPRRDLPPTSPYPLAQLQEIRWGMADANERNDATGAAAAIVERHILPLLGDTGTPHSPDLATVEPRWVARIFALPAGAQETTTACGVSVAVLIEPVALEVRHNPVQIVAWQINVTNGMRDRLRRVLKDLYAGADRHCRPIEIRIRDQAWIGSSAELDSPDALQRYIREMESLGFHRLARSEDPTVVPMAYFPPGLDFPFTDAHRNLARVALGLIGRSARVHRNAFMAAQGTADYALWMEMRTSGYARKSDDIAGRAYFWLTPKGAEAALNPGETLIWDTLPDTAVLD